MSFDYVITPLFGAAADAPALGAALAIGRRFKAHLEVMHARIDPAAWLYVVGQGVSGAMVDQMLEASRREVEERSARAHETFAHETEGVTRADEPLETKAFTVGWRELDGRPSECVGRSSDASPRDRPAGMAPAMRNLAGLRSQATQRYQQRGSANRWIARPITDRRRPSLTALTQGSMVGAVLAAVTPFRSTGTDLNARSHRCTWRGA
jgi:hypothetical protein